MKKGDCLKSHIKMLQLALRRLRDAKLDCVNMNSYTYQSSERSLPVSKAMWDGITDEYALVGSSKKIIFVYLERHVAT